MFSKVLSGLTLTNNFADAIFPNITGSDYSGDKSFVATMRALLAPRIGKDEEVKLVASSSTYGADAIRGAGCKALINAALGASFPKPGRLYVNNVKSGNQNDRDAFFECIDDPEKGFAKQYGFTELTMIRNFVADNMRARFYTNPDLKVSVIFVDSLNVWKWHLIQAFTTQYFSWWFVKSPFTQDEVKLLKTLTMRKSENYELLIEEFSNKYDMRSAYIDSALGELERNSRKVQLESVDDSISNTRHRIDMLLEEYDSLLQNIDELNLRRLGLVEIINNASTESELVDYFKSDKRLDLIDVHGHTFEFIVRTYLDSWDPEMFERFADRPTSNFYEGYTVRKATFANWEVRKKFLKAVFSDSPLFRIKMCGYYRLDLMGHATSQSRYSYPANCSDRLPNPHLQKYNCLGNHERLINDLLRKGDSVGAVAQCGSSCGSINLAESQTYTYFLDMLFNSTAKVVELPDGTSVSPEEALNWLNEHEKKEEEQHA